MRRVVKVGGSLLDRVDLTGVLSRWVEQQEDGETLVVVGGGALVDVIRELDAIRPADPVDVHWLCVDLLGVTFRLMSNWFEWQTVHTPAQLRMRMATGFSRDEPTLVAVGAFYSRDQDGNQEYPMLPRNWQTTTDAIAALLAWRTGADELVILKSCSIDPELSLDQLAAQGIVDQAFPRIAKRVPSIRIERL